MAAQPKNKGKKVTSFIRSDAKVLIVDDDESFLESLEEVFELEDGYEVLTAKTAKDAEKAVKESQAENESQPIIALVDVKLGRSNGLELVKKIKKNNSNIICIMITGHEGLYDSPEAESSGANEFLYKPLDPDSLLKILEKHLDNEYFEHQKKGVESRFQCVFDQSSLFLYLIDTDGMIIEANKTALSICPLDRQKIIGTPFWQLPNWAASSEHKIVALKQRLRGAVLDAAESYVTRLECEVLNENAEKVSLVLSIKPIINENDEVVLVIAEGRDISKLKEAVQHQLHLAHYDALTKLTAEDSARLPE